MVGSGSVRAAADLKTHARIGFYGKSNRRARPGLILLYHLAERVNIPKRWPMRLQVQTVWNARWPSNCIEALEYAIRSSYEKAGREYKPGQRYGKGSNQHSPKFEPSRGWRW